MIVVNLRGADSVHIDTLGHAQIKWPFVRDIAGIQSDFSTKWWFEAEAFLVRVLEKQQLILGSYLVLLTLWHAQFFLFDKKLFTSSTNYEGSVLCCCACWRRLMIARLALQKMEDLEHFINWYYHSKKDNKNREEKIGSERSLLSWKSKRVFIFIIANFYYNKFGYFVSCWISKHSFLCFSSCLGEIRARSMPQKNLPKLLIACKLDEALLEKR